MNCNYDPKKILKNVWGQGNYEFGYSLFLAISRRLETAREKHPDNGGGKGIIGSLDAIESEVGELRYAVENETIQRQYDEALDVIVTAMRFANDEYLE